VLGQWEVIVVYLRLGVDVLLPKRHAEISIDVKKQQRVICVLRCVCVLAGMQVQCAVVQWQEKDERGRSIEDLG
jgi:hypothetical protein